MMKTVLVLLDGIGDRSYKVLNHRTPLQAADTPHLDWLARMGANGLFHGSVPGQCLPSETAHHLLLGYDIHDFPGRGLLEAVGSGVIFDDTDVLSLAHLSGINWEDGVPILCQGRKDFEKDEEEMRTLFAAITPHKIGDIHFRIHQTHINDAILIISGKVSPYVSDSDPMISGNPVARIQPLVGNPEPGKALRTATAMNAYLTRCHRILDRHEINRSRHEKKLPLANFLATQRCGRRNRLEPFYQRWGLKGMMIASMPIYGGMANEMGLTYIKAKDGDNPEQDLKERIRLALDDSSHDFIHIHTKTPDEAAHSGDPQRKQRVITALDRAFQDLINAVERKDDLLVVITADHSTPSISPLIHSGEPVPIILVGATIRRDDVDRFDEINAAKGCLGLLRGRELMLTILNYGDRSSLLGHNLGGMKRAYFPKDYEPFKLTDEHS
jgi:2,3-bisphosphoglycerate-independent phosphoglycerate mutase